MTEVWRIDVRRYGGEIAVLSPEEAERATRFRFEPARRSFVATRTALRTLIGSCLGLAPSAVVFGYGANGKPEAEGVSFNVSHSGGVALIALGTGRIGVDVEEMRADVEMRALAHRFFTSSENAALDRLSGAAYMRAFYGCWTRKEAFVKAVGEGLSFALDRFEVSLDGWTLAEVDAGPGYAAAVAVDVENAEVAVREWAESAAA